MPASTHRRDFLKSLSLGLGALTLARPAAAANSDGPATGATATPTPARPLVACNQYTWHTFYARDGKNFDAELESGLDEVKESGLDGFEPSAASAEQIAAMGARLNDRGLRMDSLYVNSTLHDPAEADRSIEAILRIGEAAKAHGARVIVTNPNPLQWGADRHKDDDQLRIQAWSLERLGARLRELDLTLAYHNHDIELRQGAREFHHMLVGTDPEYVTLCLDTHWIYRGTGNSQVALFDIIHLYGKRVSALHLRQSQGGVWTEVFGEGDIDYPAVARALGEAGARRPLIVLEQAVEGATPHTLGPVEAHRQGAAYARQVFAALAGGQD